MFLRLGRYTDFNEIRLRDILILEEGLYYCPKASQIYSCSSYKNRLIFLIPLGGVRNIDITICINNLSLCIYYVNNYEKPKDKRYVFMFKIYTPSVLLF